MVSTAPTCGISKSGGTLVQFDRNTGRKVEEIDEETGEAFDTVDDKLQDDMKALSRGFETGTLRYIPSDEVSMRFAVPTYYDRRYHEAFTAALGSKAFRGFTSSTVGALHQEGTLVISNGHGSAPKDVRVGDVPYIKVSDLRAGFVNINPTNRVPRKLADYYWGPNGSGLKAFDILCPERASKNIGDFCVLMPGQERILLTKEVIVIRPGPEAIFDSFYMLWAMSLKIVRDQWSRVVFMQTNREDVGDRYLEIEIPVPPDAETAYRVSDPFRQYYRSIANARIQLGGYLDESQAHHFFVAGDSAHLEDAPDEDEAD
jgi:type I restriction enzyme M protein